MTVFTRRLTGAVVRTAGQLENYKNPCPSLFCLFLLLRNFRLDAEFRQRGGCLFHRQANDVCE